MPLGWDNPHWVKLKVVLTDLTEATGGSFSFVVDEGNGLWCVGSKHVVAGAEEKADAFYRRVVAPHMRELCRGKKLEVVQTTGDDRYVAMSFASLYVVVIWFDGDFDAFTARAKMRSALPVIEPLIVSMPPPNGPDAGQGARRA